jgi:hypothetical protein
MHCACISRSCCYDTKRPLKSVPLFYISIPAKRLDLNSLKGQTKTEELETLFSQFLSLRLALKAL